MENFIRKHLGINTPQWVVDNCKKMLEEWDGQDKNIVKKHKLYLMSDGKCDLTGNSCHGSYNKDAPICQKCKEGQEIKQL